MCLTVFTTGPSQCIQNHNEVYPLLRLMFVFRVSSFTFHPLTAMCFDVVFLCVESTQKSSAIFVCSLTGATAPCPCVAATRCPDRRSQRHILSDLPQVVPRRGGPHGAHEAHT
jgi:hypothetical protein